MDITSPVATGIKDPTTLPQTRIVRTFVQDAARLQGIQDITPASAPPETKTPDVPTPPAAHAPEMKEVPPAPAKESPMLVFPARTPVPVVPTQSEAARLSPQGPAALHTYQIDFAEHVKETNASPLSVLAAERDAQSASILHEQFRPSHTKQYIVLGVLLLALGGGGSYAAYRYLAPKTAVIFSTNVQSLIFADEQQELTGTSGETLQEAVRASTQQTLAQGGVRILYIATSTTDTVGKQTLPGKALIDALKLKAPDILLRNSLPESTFGILHAGEETRPFFIFKVASYESTFRGMLDWEATIATDLDLFYPPYPLAETTATTTDAGSVSQPVEEAPAPTFADETVSNTDVRVLRDETGRAIILYGYRDKTTLIIARDANAFTEIVQRLSATRQE